MDSLRWVLLIIGVVVVAAIYVGGQFGRRDTVRPKNRPHHLVEENDAPVESFPASEEIEPDIADWEAAPEVQYTHDPDTVQADWEGAEEEAKPSAHPQAPAVDIKPLVLVLTVLAPHGKPWSGDSLRNALEAEGLRHGEMNIFHFHHPQYKDAVFSVANAMEPGVFDLPTMSELETPGITLFCQLPGPLENEVAFDFMLDKARALAGQLGGHVCDDRRNPLTAQTVSHYHDRIETFSRELTLARKKAAEKQSEAPRFFAV